MTTTSKAFELIPLEHKKLIKSFLLSLWGVTAYFLMVLIDFEAKKYLAMDIPEEVKIAITIFSPFLVNAFWKWAGEHHYTVKSSK